MPWNIPKTGTLVHPSEPRVPSQEMVCAASEEASSSSAAPGCGHPFCAGCMRQYVRTEVDGSVYHIACPEPGCKLLLGHYNVVRLLQAAPDHLSVRCMCKDLGWDQTGNLYM